MMLNRPAQGPGLIGLTGGIATGKSGIARIIKGRGIALIDLDEISHALSIQGAEALPLIRQAFGDELFQGDCLDRRRLAALVFSDRAALEKLNSLMHPLIFKRMNEQLLIYQAEPLVVIDAPLLYETGLYSYMDEVWCAYAPYDEQLQRLMKRDGLSVLEAKGRISNQWPTDKKARLSDLVIFTTGSREETERTVNKALDMALANTKNKGKEK